MGRTYCTSRRCDIIITEVSTAELHSPLCGSAALIETYITVLYRPWGILGTVKIDIACSISSCLFMDQADSMSHFMKKNVEPLPTAGPSRLAEPLKVHSHLCAVITQVEI